MGIRPFLELVQKYYTFKESEMIIIDGDYPMAIGAIGAGRDLKKPIDEVRKESPVKTRALEWDNAETMATIPEMRNGKIAAALVKVVACVVKPGHSHGEFVSAEAAYGWAQGQLAYYKLLEHQNEIKILSTKSSFKTHMELWESQEDKAKDLPVGFILGMEGADSIVYPEQVNEWYEEGLRVISLSHYGVSYYSHGTGTGTDGGLTKSAKPLLKEMEKLNIILDVSHTSDQSVREEFKLFDGPVLASHQNCRSLVPGERQQPDDILKEVISRGGVIGSSMDTYMLNKNYELDWGGHIPNRREIFSSESITLEDFVDHIDYICQLSGNSNHAAIGGDTDGQGGAEGAPHDVDTVKDYMKISDILNRRGYKKTDIENVMYKNWSNLFKKELSD